MNRSVRGPIVWGSISVALSITLMVGWILVIARRPDFSQALLANVSLLVGGIVSTLTIATVLILFSIFLVREIREVRRQYSFIDSVTHELKSPLASLRLCLETMARRELQDDQRVQLRTMMLRDVDRLTVFIDDILEASRLGTGKRAYALDNVTLLPLAVRCADVVGLRHKLQPGWLDLDVAPSLSVLSDETALETIVKNLLDNAVKYSRDEIKVALKAEQETDGVRLTVTDQGIGIPPRQLKRVFERFYRVPTEDVYTRQGTGLGLFVVASLVRALGGEIEARSQGEGHGTSMVLRLPTGGA